MKVSALNRVHKQIFLSYIRTNAWGGSNFTTVCRSLFPTVDKKRKETYTQPKSSAGDFYGLVHLLFIETIHDI